MHIFACVHAGFSLLVTMPSNKKKVRFCYCCVCCLKWLTLIKPWHLWRVCPTLTSTEERRQSELQSAVGYEVWQVCFGHQANFQDFADWQRFELMPRVDLWCLRSLYQFVLIAISIFFRTLKVLLLYFLGPHKPLVSDTLVVVQPSLFWFPATAQRWSDLSSSTMPCLQRPTLFTSTAVRALYFDLSFHNFFWMCIWWFEYESHSSHPKPLFLRQHCPWHCMR